VLQQKVNYLAFSGRTGIVGARKLKKHDAKLVLDEEARFLEEYKCKGETNEMFMANHRTTDPHNVVTACG